MVKKKKKAGKKPANKRAGKVGRKAIKKRSVKVKVKKRILKDQVKDKRGLTNRQKVFVNEYMKCFKTGKAAQEAGLEENYASTMMQKKAVKAEIGRRISVLTDKSKVTSERIIKEFAKLGFSNITDFIKFDENGVTVIDSEMLPRDISACISEVKIRTDKDGVTTTEVKLHGKNKPLELLGKNLKMFTDKLDVEFKGDMNFNITKRYPHKKCDFADKKKIVKNG